MGINEISEYLPHRYPFLLVDRVTKMEIGQAIEGFKNVSCNEAFFQGHFPGHPIMPGVLILEAMAQLAGILGFKTKGIKPTDGMLYYFAGTNKVRFKKPVMPGDRLDMAASFIAEKRGVWRFECQAEVDNELACSAELLCVEREI